MQYLLLIYNNEKNWTELPDADAGALMGDYRSFTRVHRQVGSLQGRQRAPADEHGDHRSRPERQAHRDRWSVRRNARAARRLLSRRREGSR